MSITGPPAIFGDAWWEEKRRRGLPWWATVWRESQAHDFQIGGERYEVVRACIRYADLLVLAGPSPRRAGQGKIPFVARRRPPPTSNDQPELDFSRPPAPTNLEGLVSDILEASE